jgi:hypothetical protein
VTKRILENYNKKPEGWNVLTDRKGNILFIGPNASYRLKLIPLSPQKYTGVGSKIKSPKEFQGITEGLPTYGFRPLSEEALKSLLSSIQQTGEFRSTLINKLLRITPLPASKIREKKPKSVLTGPIITHPDLSVISKSQKELEERLSREADKLFRKRYPLRTGIYS